MSFLSERLYTPEPEPEPVEDEQPAEVEVVMLRKSRGVKAGDRRAVSPETADRLVSRGLARY